MSVEKAGLRTDGPLWSCKSDSYHRASRDYSADEGNEDTWDGCWEIRLLAEHNCRKWGCLKLRRRWRGRRGNRQSRQVRARTAAETESKALWTTSNKHKLCDCWPDCKDRTRRSTVLDWLRSSLWSSTSADTSKRPTKKPRICSTIAFCSNPKGALVSPVISFELSAARL